MGFDLRKLALETIDQLYGKGHVEFLEQISELSFIGHDPIAGTLSLHEEERVARSFREGFPDLHCRVVDLVAEGDRVVCRWRANGTHTGPFMSIAPTGRRVEIDGLTLLRFHGERLAEAWTQYDALRLLGQIGEAPAAAHLAGLWQRQREAEERLAQH